LSSEQFVQPESFVKAREFVDALRLTDKRWYPYAEQFVFRGQADATWNLRPSLWRAAEAPPKTNQYLDFARSCMYAKVSRLGEGEPPPIDALTTDQKNLIVAGAVVIAESLVVTKFALLADELGMSLPIVLDEIDPDASMQMVNQIAQAVVEGNLGTGLRASSLALIALAQHHQIPTRLLDWTANPLVAAFFAADDALTKDWKGQDPSHIAVWSINVGGIEAFTNMRVRCVRASHQSNPFMQAQRGCFTWDVQGEHEYATKGRWPVLDDVCTRVCPNDQPLPLTKLTLPLSECRELLRLLRLEGISRAHLMPTLDNVARTTMMSTSRLTWPTVIWTSRSAMKKTGALRLRFGLNE
jgi:FRG domain